ncbi:MAG: UvrB/UvrC motif-containing protein [Pirellulales bacterium]|nr:UvrB/UvrC motif-containing protein [Pirellulales bacterium]
MTRRRDVDDAMRGWPFRPGSVSARLVRARDGREIVQMRIDLGVLQMEVDGRPDGERPGGMSTYLDYLASLAIGQGDSFEINQAQSVEVDREFQQYYQRRLCWLALHEFRRALSDADHTLALMDFVATHANHPAWIAAHERYRPFVLFHRTQAAALAAVGYAGPEVALAEIEDGLRRIRLAGMTWPDDADEDAAEEQEEMIGQLLELKEWIRSHYRMGQTLAEQLADAVASERYELAARLRDEIARRRRSRSV